MSSNISIPAEVKPKHTPGPLTRTDTHAGRSCVDLFAPSGELIATLYSIDRPETEGTLEGNANLFSGAPTLLAALENLECPECGHLLKCHADKSGCVSHGNGPCLCTCEEMPDLQAAVEAIRLAKGGAQ
jgi:hypothetical protein